MPPASAQVRPQLIKRRGAALALLLARAQLLAARISCIPLPRNFPRTAGRGPAGLGKQGSSKEGLVHEWSWSEQGAAAFSKEQQRSNAATSKAPSVSLK